MRVEFLAFGQRFSPDREVVKQLVGQAGQRNEFILKRNVVQLEEEIRAFTGAGHAVATANATNALTLCLKAWDVGPGDGVLTPAFSFISSASAVSLVGARPLFVDVEPSTGTLSVEDLPRRLTKTAKVILPVHLFSSLAEMGKIGAFARAHGLRVLEDSAVCLGARLDDRPVGRFGEAAVFSFFPAKPLGGIGDGGMVITDDETTARRCRMLRNHGQDGVHRFVHHEVGFNNRMDEITAGFVLYRLSRFAQDVRRRRELGLRYTQQLECVKPRLQPVLSPHAGRIFYQYVVQADRRDALRAHLFDRGIETRVQFPLPLPAQAAFADLGHQRSDFPGAERLCERVLSLPLYPELRDDQVDFVAESVVRFYS